MVTKKRFIAGAVCAQCQSMDTLALTKELGVETITCVNCGTQMKQPEAAVEKQTRQAEQIIGVFNPE